MPGTIINSALLTVPGTVITIKNRNHKKKIVTKSPRGIAVKNKGNKW